MAIKALNRKAESLLDRPPDDVRPYNFADCCPGFLPGWEVGDRGDADPCSPAWLRDLPACHPCYWTAQVPDSATYPNWRDSCANVSQDWVNLEIVE